MADDFSRDGKETNPVRPGRASFVPGEDQRGLVREMVSKDFSHDCIASSLNISVPTLRKYFKEELRDRMGAHNLFAAAGHDPPITKAEAPPSAKRPGAGGRKRFQPLIRDRDRVSALVASGMPVEDIARAIGISPPTLRRHFRDELATGAIVKRAEVIGAIFRKAIGGSVAAMKVAVELMDKAELGELSRNIGAGSSAQQGVEKPAPVGKKAQADLDAQDVVQSGPWAILADGQNDRAH